MAWTVVYSDNFEQWWDELAQEQQEALTARLELLKHHGPSLGRPVVDHIEGSRHQNMKEMRASKGSEGLI